MRVNFHVDGMHIERSGSAQIVSQSIEFVELAFDFSSDWDGLTKYAELWQGVGETTYWRQTFPLAEDGTMYLPDYALPGIVYFGVYGIDPMGDTRATTDMYMLKISASSYKGDAPPIPPPEPYLIDLQHGGTGVRTYADLMGMIGLKTDGDGTRYLADDHTYKSIDSGAIDVPDDQFFETETDRDAFFATHANRLVKGAYCVVSGELQKYDGTTWVDMSAVVRGPVGPIGPQGATGGVSYPTFSIDGNGHVIARYPDGYNGVQWQINRTNGHLEVVNNG